MQTVIVRGEGITLDLLLWRAYGVRGRSLLESALSLNVDMARLGTVIPMGTEVILPDLPPDNAGQPREVVSLFG
ncbi:phage tail protein X [Ochrobactrum daejeonense]|uniref:Phage tail protein X n=1 Tax=Brucella daejeonensis TaxID=659015 RepID=A0A7W9EMM3_9HYPH|nr:tail protein X [Brucella daejeonensis]MBB5703618.1 phage tail protein X [Brucella daejeonensis]